MAVVSHAHVHAHAMRRYPPGPLEAPPPQPPYYVTTNHRTAFVQSPDPSGKTKRTWGQRLKLGKNSPQPPVSPVPLSEGPLYGTIGGPSALSRSMKYAETWLYGTVRGPPNPQQMFAPFPNMAVMVCSCSEYLSGTKSGNKKATVCKKCKGSRLPLVHFGGTVRAQAPAPSSVMGTIRAGTVRLTPTTVKVRPTILNVNHQGDPYDVMRRSRLVSPEPQMARRASKEHIPSRAKSTSPSRGRTRRRSPSADDPTPADRSRSASRTQGDGVGDATTRKSILECDVNPYDLISKNGNEKPMASPTEDDVFDSADELSDNVIDANQRYENLRFNMNKEKSNDIGVTAIGGQRIRVFGESRTPSIQEDFVYESIDLGSQINDTVDFRKKLTTKIDVKSVIKVKRSPSIESRKEQREQRERSVHIPRFSKIRSISPKRPPRRTKCEFGEDENESDLNGQGTAPNSKNSETSLGPDLSKQPVHSAQDLSSIKSILKKPRESSTFNDTDNVASPAADPLPHPATLPQQRTSPAAGRRVSGSHFYLPTPASPVAQLTPRKKVQFLVENEMLSERRDMTADSTSKENRQQTQNKIISTDELATETKIDLKVDHFNTDSDHGSRVDMSLQSGDVDLNQEAVKQSFPAVTTTVLSSTSTDVVTDRDHIPTAGLSTDNLTSSRAPSQSSLKRSHSDRQSSPAMSKIPLKFNDTTALRVRIPRPDARKLFGSPRGPPPPPPLLLSQKEKAPSPDHPMSNSISSCINELLKASPNEFKVSKTSFQNGARNDQHKSDKTIEDVKHPSAPSPPPRHVFPFTKKMFEESTNETKIMELTNSLHSPSDENLNNCGDKHRYRNRNIRLDIVAKPNRNVVQISPEILNSSAVHRLEVKHDSSEYDRVLALKKTSILINGDECYSTVNVSDDMPLYQSSVVVNDCTTPPLGITQTTSNTVTISVGTPRTPEEEIIYKNNKNIYFMNTTKSSCMPVNSTRNPVIHEVPAYASTPIIPSNIGSGSTFVNLDYDTAKSPTSTKTTFAEVQRHRLENGVIDGMTVSHRDYKVNRNSSLSNNTRNEMDESPSSEELSRILQDPVEAVRRNLVPHVCGKIEQSDVIRRPRKKPTAIGESTPKSSGHSGFVAKLLEDPTLGHLAEGLENELVSKLIESSLIRLKESRTSLDTSGTADNDSMTKMIDISLQKLKEERISSTAFPQNSGTEDESTSNVSNRNSSCSEGNSNRNSISSAPYETLEYDGITPGETSDCYQSSASELTIEDDNHLARSKFYQMLVDATLSEIEISTNIDDDHHYESIRINSDPIYEEIGEVPPPLPLSPPPVSNDDSDLDKKYTSRSIFEGASKYDILSYLVDAKERGIVPEESYSYNFGNAGEIVIEEEDEKLSELHQRLNSDLSSRVSQLSNASDSSEDSSLSNIIITSVPEKLQASRKTSAEIERNDSGVGSETSKSSRSRWQSHTLPPGSILDQDVPIHLCEDCDSPVETQVTESGVMYAPLVCRKCGKKRAERKEIITEIVETEEKYGRDLQIILEEFYQPMLVAGLLTQDQLSAIFLNTEELLENNQSLAERLRDTLEIAIEQGDEDLLTVNIGKIFVEAAPMLHAFENYCIRQGAASLLLANLEKDKELLRIFLRVSQMENTVLRRMNLNSFLMVPVQRVTKYPLLLARLHKVTPTHHEGRENLKQAQQKIELHLNHMNSEAKDIPTKLWRRISIANTGRRSSCEIDMINIKLRKMAVDVLEWNHDDARFAMEGKLLFTQPTDNNWRKGRTIKLTHINALLVTNGKPSSNYRAERCDNEPLAFPRHTGIREASLLLVKEKGGRYTLLREPLYLDRCVVCSEADWDDYFEVQEVMSKDTFIFKAEDGSRTKQWYTQLQYHAQGMGAWRKRRNALANIMINGMMSRT